jgi:hypothetical protein
MINNQLSGGGAGTTGYPVQGTAISDVVKGLIDDMNDLKLFREFVLQDPIMLEKYEQYKIFKILKSK